MLVYLSPAENIPYLLWTFYIPLWVLYKKNMLQVRSSESGADLGHLSRELAAISHLDISTRKDDPSFVFYYYTEPVLLNVYGAPELILRNEFRQPM